MTSISDTRPEVLTPPPFQTIAALRDAIVGAGNLPAEFVTRMLHPVPELPTVKDRKAYLIEKAKDRVVLDIGCTGDISLAIRQVAKTYYGVDRVPVTGCDVVDLDHRPDLMPKHEGVELIICSEMIEHLANPGYFLMALRENYPVGGAELLLTVPHAGGYQTHQDCEVVNGDHVAWYSYTTLKTLLGRYGYEIQEARWYNGEPHKAEGLIVKAK